MVCARYYVKCFGTSNFYHLPLVTPLLAEYCYQFHFTAEDKNAQRGSVTFQRSQSQQEGESRSELR